MYDISRYAARMAAQVRGFCMLNLMLILILVGQGMGNLSAERERERERESERCLSGEGWMQTGYFTHPNTNTSTSVSIHAY